MARVVCLLSGGVDSSVAAALLKKQGDEVIGVYILGWTGEKGWECSWQTDEADARAVATKLDIPFYTVNLTIDYRREVFQPFLESYRRGQTPNPDVLCNQQVKFKALWRAVRQLEPDYLASGHYANISQISTHKSPDLGIFKAADDNKDQSYFLWGIDRAILPKIIFPLGQLTKPAVRQLAANFKLPTAAKKDSQGICFVGQLKIGDYLASRLTSRPGPVVLTDGRMIARHQGFWFYTIGQRLGGQRSGGGQLDWTGDRPPLFVAAKDLINNRLIVGHDSDCLADRFQAEGANWLAKLSPPTRRQFECLVKIRYRQEDVNGLVEISDQGVRVRLDRMVRAITPGQSVVFYSRGAQLLGGATITKVDRQTELINALKSLESTPTDPEPATIG